MQDTKILVDRNLQETGTPKHISEGEGGPIHIQHGNRRGGKGRSTEMNFWPVSKIIFSTPEHGEKIMDALKCVFDATFFMVSHVDQGEYWCLITIDSAASIQVKIQTVFETERRAMNISCYV